jgi:hypothetical protein
VDLVDGSIVASAGPWRFPCAPVQVRQQAADQEPIVNLHLRLLRLDDPDLRRLTPLLDGTRDLRALQSAWAAESGTACSETWLRSRLAELGRLAVLSR